MNIYIAGKVTAQERLRPIRHMIRTMGYECASTWINGATDYPQAFGETADRDRDLIEIYAADLLILDTLDESNTGGREFEIGYAHGILLPFWRVGPQRHIFHSLAAKTFENWQDVLNALGAKLDHV